MRNANGRGISHPGRLPWAPPGLSVSQPALGGNFGKHKPGIPVVQQWAGEGQSFLDTDPTLGPV